MSAEPLTSAQLAGLRDELLELRDQLRAHLKVSEDADKPVDLEEPIGRLSRMDAMQQQKMASANRRNSELRLERIGGALAAMDRGDYGACRECEEPIGFRRLKARPETGLCLSCQRSSEQRR